MQEHRAGFGLVGKELKAGMGKFSATFNITVFTIFDIVDVST